MKTKLLTSFLLVLVIAGYFAFSESPPAYQYQGEKMKGLSFVAPNKPVDSCHFTATDRVYANWLSLMPYGFVRDDSPVFHFTPDTLETSDAHQWWGESPQGVRKCIELAKANGQKIMLKPHMWWGHGNFTGDFTQKTEADWQTFENTYGEYILQYARLAEDEGVELFCIATEMRAMVEQRPEFWKKLIAEIRKVYSGKLTYAENWDSIEDVGFWEDLDFIGVDGYFPLSNKKDPGLNDLKKGWQKHLKQLENLSVNYQKPILFTEYGFRSCDFATEKPWETDYSLPDNEGLQARAYQSFYEEVWTKPWMAGGFIWKWFPFKEAEKASRDKFCPQHKEAEKVIAYFYNN